MITKKQLNKHDILKYKQKNYNQWYDQHTTQTLFTSQRIATNNSTMPYIATSHYRSKISYELQHFTLTSSRTLFWQQLRPNVDSTCLRTSAYQYPNDIIGHSFIQIYTRVHNTTISNNNNNKKHIISADNSICTKTIKGVFFKNMTASTNKYQNKADPRFSYPILRVRWQYISSDWQMPAATHDARHEWQRGAQRSTEMFIRQQAELIFRTWCTLSCFCQPKPVLLVSDTEFDNPHLLIFTVWPKAKTVCKFWNILRSCHDVWNI